MKLLWLLLFSSVLLWWRYGRKGVPFAATVVVIPDVMGQTVPRAATRGRPPWELPTDYPDLDPRWDEMVQSVSARML